MFQEHKTVLHWQIPLAHCRLIHDGIVLTGMLLRWKLPASPHQPIIAGCQDDGRNPCLFLHLVLWLHSRPDYT
jgi:hypothetical protein